MKKYIWLLICLLPLLTIAQEPKVDSSNVDTWKELERLIEIKNYTQTLPLLNRIKTSARTNNRSAEWIRAVLAENLALRVNHSDDAAFTVVKDHLERHINEGNQVEQAILQNFYAQYLHQNRYRYLSDSNDPFMSQNQTGRDKTVDSLFTLSLSAKERLVEENIEDWKAMFGEQKNVTLTPTLFHFLAHPYLHFLRNVENKDDKKVASVIRELELLNRVGKYNDATAYLLSHQLTINEWNIDTQLPKFLAVIDKQESNYNAYLLYQIAAVQQSRDPKEALTYIHRALDRYPESPWINEVKNLSNTIKKAHITLNHDKFAPAQMYTPIKLAAKNADTLYMRVYNTTNQPTNYKNYQVKYDSLNFSVQLDAPLVYEDMVILKAFDDYKEHKTIYKLNPLSYGNYTILLSNNPSFHDDGLFLDVTKSKINITDQFISTTIDEEDDKKFVYKTLLINRKTGAPYRQKKVQLYETSEHSEPKLIETVRTNNTGEFTYKTNYAQDRIDLEEYALYLVDEKQFIDLGELNNIESHVYRENRYARTDHNIMQTMTDRAIYRPGQTVYFKSILYDSHSLYGKTLEKQEVQLLLHDANNQKIDSLTLVTNGFGSVNGLFQLPNQTLPGSFRIVAFHDNQQVNTQRIRVEEYKRPTFKTSFETNKETYTLRDTAVFTGLAETLSGVPLVDATVHYKVNFYHTKQQKTVSFADTTTTVDDKGKFRIAVPLMDMIFTDLTDFTLQYTAEVVSQTGEMQAASERYRFSAKPWIIQIRTEGRVEEKKWKEIHIRTVNQNWQPLKFSGKVDIYKYDVEPKIALTDEKIVFFHDTEYHMLSQAEYQQFFPYYFDPVLLHKDASKTRIASYDFHTSDTTLVRIDSSLFVSGRYWIDAYTIQEGDTIRSETDLSVYKTNTRKVTATEFLVYQLDKAEYDIGDKVTITFETDVPNAKKLFLFEVHGHKKAETRILDWKNGKIQHSFVLQKEHVWPNLLFNALLVVDNKAAIASVYIPIQRSDKALSIKTSTFRDKITPGQSEKWRFTITHKDEAAQAEVLATMYDAALDMYARNMFPTALQLNYSYYGQPNFHYLLREFQHKEKSLDMFRKQQWYKTQGNGLSMVYSYGVLSEGSLFNSVGTVEEVAVMYDQMEEVVPNGAVVGLQSKSLVAETNSVMIRGTATSDRQEGPLFIVDGEIMEGLDLSMLDQNQIARVEILKDASATALYGSRGANGVILITTKDGQKKQAQLDAVQARSNLGETAFFYPELYTDLEGNVSFEFDSPEALSRWKLLLFAHGKNLEAGSATFFTQTQKQLMVRPNLPRYFREGDQITLKAQIQNLSKENLSGNARIEMINPENNQQIAPAFLGANSTKSFDVAAENNSIVEWQLKVPAGYPTVQIKIVAATDEFSDGEQHELPILPNKVLISDTEKIILNPEEQREYEIHGAGKENLHARVQVQTNPILEILSALDYLKNYPYECTEQTTSKWFALQMVRYIQKHYPALSDYFAKLNQENVKGRLEENSTLHELTIEEMPWLRDIQGEEAKRKALARLFASNLQADINDLEKKISKSQLDGGAFPWFEGGKSNTAISIRILEVTGKVLQLDPTLVSKTVRQSMQKLIISLDKDSTLFDSKRHTLQVLDYLYARHYWNGLYKLDASTLKKLSNELLKSPEVSAQNAAGIAAKSWVVNQLSGDAKQSNEIKNRITQEVIHDQEKGMYWESNQKRFNAISLHSYLVEAYKLHDPSKLYEITQWIYYNKQANHWRSTWATVDAIYALLLANDPRDFSLDNSIKIWVDQEEISTQNVVLGQSTKDFKAEELKGNRRIAIQNNNNRRVYGSVVHQYLVPVEEASRTTNAISVQKQYYVERQGEWVEANTCKLGEKIKVKITVINDSPLEYVHLKDARPSAVEPIYRRSGYQWRHGYYFSLKDASTNYFFDFLPKGKREFEYEVKANNAGTFQSGITTIECMYDPAVNARSSSVVVMVTE